MADQVGPGELSEEAAGRLSGPMLLRPVGDVDPLAARRARLARAAALWSELEAEHEDTVVPDPALQRPVGEPTQYPEGTVAVSGGAIVDDAFERALREGETAGD